MNRETINLAHEIRKLIHGPIEQLDQISQLGLRLADIVIVNNDELIDNRELEWCARIIRLLERKKRKSEKEAVILRLAQLVSGHCQLNGIYPTNAWCIVLQVRISPERICTYTRNVKADSRVEAINRIKQYIAQRKWKLERIDSVERLRGQYQGYEGDGIRYKHP